MENTNILLSPGLYDIDDSLIISLFNPKTRIVYFGLVENYYDIDKLYLNPLKENKFIDSELQQLYNETPKLWKCYIAYVFPKEITKISVKTHLLRIFMETIEICLINSKQEIYKYVKNGNYKLLNYYLISNTENIPVTKDDLIVSNDVSSYFLSHKSIDIFY